jgi:hypothetical protein
MRRGIRVALVCLGGLAAGCAQGSSPTDEDVASPPVVALQDPSDVPPPETTSPATMARAPRRPSFAVTTPFVHVDCRKGAFCEDFEEASPGARWTSSVATDGGVIDFVGPSSSFGAHALRATTSGSGAAAYLMLAGPTVAQQWVGSLTFSMRVESLPTTVLGGPEITVTDPNGAVTRIGFSVHPNGIALHQYFDSCSGLSCTARADIVTDVKPGEWRRLSVGIEGTGSSAAPYGRIEVTVDDSGDLITLPLAVTPFDGYVEVHAGITIADSVASIARVDDVVFFTH